MKGFFLTILSTLIFMASFQNSLILVDYQINRDFYEVHCENKAKPEMDCHGKCQMKKESEKSTSPFKLLKYSFEFNILPNPPVAFTFEKVPSFRESNKIHAISNFDLQNGFFIILPDPPQA